MTIADGIVLCDDGAARNGQKALMVFSRVTTKAGIPFHRHAPTYIWRGRAALIICVRYCRSMDHSSRGTRTLNQGFAKFFKHDAA